VIADHVKLGRRGDQPVVDLPRIENRLGEDQARVARELRLVEIAAVPDDREHRDLPVVQRISNGVARLEQPRALDHDEGGRATKIETRRDLPRLPLSADTHEPNPIAPLDRRFPPPDRAIGNGDHVRDADLGEEGRDLVSREH
jgi:hypothetical protein